MENLLTKKHHDPGDEIPKGGWRGPDDEIPKGGWRGPEDEIPKGGWRGPNDEIPKGGWRAPPAQIPNGGWKADRFTTDTYRTKDGRACFAFRFVDVGTHVEIDIISTPSYGLRSTNLHSTHRLSSPRGGDKVCFGDESQLRTFSAAKQWAASWSELTWRYIQTGIPFPNN